MRVASCLFLLIASTTLLADEKPVKWEYAELTYRNTPGRPAMKDADGKEVPATEPGLTIHLTTGTDDLTATGWSDLAEKLKATLKKDSGVESQKIQVLNALGAKGWELVDVQAVPAVPAMRFGGAAAPGGGGGGGGAAQPGRGGAGGGGVAPAGRAGTTMLFKRRV